MSEITLLGLELCSCQVSVFIIALAQLKMMFRELGIVLYSSPDSHIAFNNLFSELRCVPVLVAAVAKIFQKTLKCVHFCFCFCLIEVEVIP